MRCSQCHAPWCLCEGAAWQGKGLEHAETHSYHAQRCFPVFCAAVWLCLCVLECTLKAVMVPELWAKSICTSSSEACAPVSRMQPADVAWQSHSQHLERQKAAILVM